nr:unnamed protein product [Callosobruchus chinensis]CAH7758586.1 unnamed protein product [Callosobruchus chinensis]
MMTIIYPVWAANQFSQKQ